MNFTKKNNPREIERVRKRERGRDVSSTKYYDEIYKNSAG